MWGTLSLTHTHTSRVPLLYSYYKIDIDGMYVFLYRTRVAVVQVVQVVVQLWVVVVQVVALKTRVENWSFAKSSRPRIMVRRT